MSKYSKLILDNMYQEYLKNGATYVDKKFNLKGSSTLLKRNGYKTRTHEEYSKFMQNKRLSKFNVIFDVIRNEMDAYILGFIYADGTVSEERALTAVIQNDLPILKQIQEYIGGSNGITKLVNGSNQLNIYSKIIAKNVINLGILENKGRKIASYPDFTKMDNKLAMHFIRGFFDGDGHYARQKNSMIVGFSLTNKKFLEELKEFLENNGMINGIITKLREKGSECCIRGKTYTINNDTYSLRFCNRKSLLRFHKLMYEDCNIRLEPKFQKIEEYINTVLTDKHQ
jgi:hypothetical protein